MKSFVLDASVAAKWFLPAIGEPFSAEANKILIAFVAGRVTLIVPDLFWPEISNILWKAAARNRISADEAKEAIREITRQNVPTFPSQPLARSALDISLHFGHPVYDSTYVALAVSQASPLITADEKLIRALGGYFPMQHLSMLRI